MDVLLLKGYFETGGILGTPLKLVAGSEKLRSLRPSFVAITVLFIELLVPCISVELCCWAAAILDLSA